MKNHRKLRDERRKSTWDSNPNSLDIIGQLVCTYAQQHECRILQCLIATKCLISKHPKTILKSKLFPKYQIVWTTSQASRDATYNFLEQFQLLDSKFKLFALVLYWILGLKYKHVGLKVIFFIGSMKLLDASPISLYWNPKCLDLGATRVRNPWCLVPTSLNILCFVHLK